MTAADVAAIRAALEAATPGPWVRAFEAFGQGRGSQWTYVGEVWSRPDAELIVLLRNNAEALLDALAEAEAKVARAEVLDAEFLDLRDRAAGWGKYASWGEQSDKRPHPWMTRGAAVFEECARRVRAALADQPEQVSP